MAAREQAVRVFVDDAVLGRFPPVCALSGRPSDGTMTTHSPVGDGGVPGWAWLLALAGPAGWGILLLWSVVAAPREQIEVALPCNERAFDQLRALRRRNLRALLAATAGGVATFVALFVPIGQATVTTQVLGTLAALATAAALVVAFSAKWQVWRREPTVGLDGSRRWVTVGNVAPAFVHAVNDTARARATTEGGRPRGPVDR